MKNTTIKLEGQLQASFRTANNELGLGKIIYNEDSNESIITNGKSLITYTNSKLEESQNVSEDERERISNLTKHLIHSNYGEMIACEFYFYKEDMVDLLRYMNEHSNSQIKLTFNNKLNVVSASVDGDASLVKILQPAQINAHKHVDMSCTVEMEQLLNISELLYQEMSVDSLLGVALQYSSRPVLLATENVSACISCVK